MGDDLWSVVLIVGPLLLIAVMVLAWRSNRAAVKARGPAALGTTNAVRGSEHARPDLDQEIARAERGDSEG